MSSPKRQHYVENVIFMKDDYCPQRLQECLIKEPTELGLPIYVLTVNFQAINSLLAEVSHDETK